MRVRPVESSPLSGGRRTVSEQGSTGRFPEREEVFDGKDRFEKSDPIAALRCTMRDDDASAVAENEKLSRGTPSRSV